MFILVPPILGWQYRIRMYENRSLLHLNVFKADILAFQELSGHWPTSMQELELFIANDTELKKNTNLYKRKKDKVIFQPFHKERGDGSLTILGEDNEKGGWGLDKDIQVTFP